jgi:hypothetical protein
MNNQHRDTIQQLLQLELAAQNNQLALLANFDANFAKIFGQGVKNNEQKPKTKPITTDIFRH